MRLTGGMVRGAMPQVLSGGYSFIIRVKVGKGPTSQQVLGREAMMGTGTQLALGLTLVGTQRVLLGD